MAHRHARQTDPNRRPLLNMGLTPKLMMVYISLQVVYFLLSTFHFSGTILNLKSCLVKLVPITNYERIQCQIFECKVISLLHWIKHFSTNCLNQLAHSFKLVRPGYAGLLHMWRTAEFKIIFLIVTKRYWLFQLK